MKKILTVLGAALAISLPAFAATSQTVNVTANVDSTLDLVMAVYQLDGNGDPVGGDLGTSMPFGTLERDTVNGVMRGAAAYTVYLGTNSSGRPYTVAATMPSLSSGSTVLPHAMVCEVISARSNGDDISGDSFPTGGQDAVMSNSTIYTSNTSGAGAVIQLVYGISGGPTPFTGWEPILLDQPSGNYSASLVYTIALS